MFESFLPCSLVEAPIAPLHSALASAQVVVIVSLISVPRLPGEDALSLLHVIEEFTIILVAIRSIILLPPAVAVLQPVAKVADVGCSIAPLVVTKAFRSASEVVTSVRISIGEDIGTLPVL